MPNTALTRREFLSTAVAASAAAPASPNVLIVLADDLGWHDVGYHGSEIRTPSIDRLASQGVRFERAYSFPVCSPTRSGLMTGRSPMRLGTGYTVIRPWSDFGVPLRERFISQAFQVAGYTTSITGKWHLGHAHKSFLPRSRGFDHAYGHLNGAIDYFTHERDGGLDWNRDGKSVREPGYSTFLLGDETVRLIRQRDKSKPFFHYLPFNSPHAPLQAPPEYLDQYATITDTKRRSFAAMVAAMDTTIGRVLSAIDDEGIASNTLVLFFSDNGGPTGSGASNTPLRAGKSTTFEGGIRVPAVMRWPGQLKAGAVSQQVMTMLDYFPTLAAAARIAPGNTLPFDGRNLWPSIRSGEIQPREDLFFSVDAGGTLRYALIDPEWKLVRELAPSGAATDSLFRIAEDPEERNNLAAKEPRRVESMTRRIADWAKLEPPGGMRHSSAPVGWRGPRLWAESARAD